MQTEFTVIPDWFPYANAGGSVAVGDVDGDGEPDVVVLMVDAPAGANTGWYRVGHRLGDDGVLQGDWGPWHAVPEWFAWENEGCGVALADVDGDGTFDLVVFMVDAPEGENAGWYRVGRALDATGAVTGGWTAWTPVPDWFAWFNAGSDVTVADVDGDGIPDLVVFMIDSSDGPNAGYYRSGPMTADGVVAQWRPWVAVPDWRFWENQGAGIAVTDLDGDGVAELVVFTVDDPVGRNGGYYSVGWRLDDRGRPADGWGPWQPVQDWRFWENEGGGLAIAPLGASGTPHLLVLAIDNPVGLNGGWYRVLDATTDLQQAPQLGVWRLLERDSGVLAVHAALLHTGSVALFAGSSNDADKAAGHEYGTAVWHYPGPDLSMPDTPVDLFCCGHAALPDGRLLASGGTEQYDPFLGLKQAVVFDPAAGPPDPASHTGAAGAWVAVPDMAGGRWYPTLLPLPDGRVLAVSGLDEHGNLNLVPEVYTDGAGWQALPVSANWPMYAHLFLLADGRVFYSGGQYGGNNGVKSAVWDLTANTVADVPGLPDPGLRNQAASVLLPPAQDQRVMIMGGGAFDPHVVVPATASTAIVDLTAAHPAYQEAEPLALARMHLCATLLPDRTVLVNGGARIEEMRADATLAAEIYNPVSGTWSRGADSRVPRLYHSVALLMPDGKVITGGSNPARKDEELRLEVYWPPYLFAGARPACAVPDPDVGYGAVVTAAVPDSGGLASACLMRPGATTHSSDSQQRLIDVPFVVTGPDAVDLQLPGSAALAPPGWYLLFVVNSAGVPSPGVWVHLT